MEQRVLPTMMVSSSLMFSSLVVILMYHRYVIEALNAGNIFSLSSALHHWSEYCRTCLCQNVYYHSGGLRLNPNLYNCGKVCLSLLNTWSGNKNEKWIPGVSTMLQVLVSIQGLILNTKPYFNEPGYAHMSGSESGEMRSQQYNEDTFVLSLRTMMYTMRRPPKVRFHFFFIGNKVFSKKEDHFMLTMMNTKCLKKYIQKRERVFEL